jgi:hypothetical protein
VTIHTSIRGAFRRAIAGTVVLCLVSTGFPSHGPRPVRAGTNTRVQASAQPEPTPSSDHFLRDSIPATLAAYDPPDSTDDGFVLPEEKSKKQLTKEIVMWTVIAAFVAFFIVKVFIEKDDDSTDSGSNGKPITPPQ